MMALGLLSVNIIQEFMRVVLRHGSRAYNGVLMLIKGKLRIKDYEADLDVRLDGYSVGHYAC